MSYLIKTVESSVKNQIESERRDYISKPLAEQASIGAKLLDEDLKKTKALDLAGKIVKNH